MTDWSFPGRSTPPVTAEAYASPKPGIEAIAHWWSIDHCTGSVSPSVAEQARLRMMKSLSAESIAMSEYAMSLSMTHASDRRKGGA